MIDPTRTIILAVALLAIAGAPSGARAGELDLTGALSNFTSSTGVGPWRQLTLSDREITGNDKPGLALTDRADADLGAPTHSLGLVLDDYHDFSPRFFGYASIGLADGNVLPSRSAYVEGDGKFGRSLAFVFGAGGGVVVNPDGTVQRYLNVGPTWYVGNTNVTLRWLPSFTNGRSGSSSGLLTVASGIAGKTVVTLTLLGGTEPPYGIVSTTTVVGIGQRVLFTGLDVKHWVNPKGGYHVGIELERLNDNTSGNLLYVRRGIIAGVFRQVGPGPAP